ncbi:hypothetical protein BN873_p60013 [Candidatus Competibacter denitrificans Run_A_D11]|uniref:Uncharacterized protein n=1 Tax=Candidatus Competibacter denitrificans Run_A_D11 TaxID=1400863 RepID=W6MEK1_9GAMM|nr:hypothetical protein BN873_p60013 [Candidatus Competibacter denitrificans Run_A_D11]
MKILPMTEIFCDIDDFYQEYGSHPRPLDRGRARPSLHCFLR